MTARGFVLGLTTASAQSHAQDECGDLRVPHSSWSISLPVGCKELLVDAAILVHCFMPLRVFRDVLGVTVQEAEVAAASLVPELRLAAERRVDPDASRAGAGQSYD